jgi:hypothetical protein
MVVGAVTQQRMSSADYRKLAGESTKSTRHGSARGEKGATTGTCRVCGGHVGYAQPAQFNTDIGYVGEVGRVVAQWCRHLRAEDCAA